MFLTYFVYLYVKCSVHYLKANLAVSNLFVIYTECNKQALCNSSFLLYAYLMQYGAMFRMLL